MIVKLETGGTRVIVELWNLLLYRVDVDESGVLRNKNQSMIEMINSYKTGTVGRAQLFNMRPN